MHYLLVLGALVLFSIGTLGLNYLLLDTRSDLMDVRLAMPAVNSAHSLMSWGASLRFDENGTFLETDDSTPWDSLGPDPGETESDFDDVDDLHGLTREFETEGVLVHATCEVRYVEGDHLDQPVSDETPFKRLTVTVTGNYLTIPIQFHAIQSLGS